MASDETKLTQDSATLHIAEIPYDSGEIQFRYARYLVWSDYHENGRMAARG